MVRMRLDRRLPIAVIHSRGIRGSSTGDIQGIFGRKKSIELGTLRIWREKVIRSKCYVCSSMDDRDIGDSKATSVMRWFILCVNLTGLRDVEAAGRHLWACV